MKKTKKFLLAGFATIVVPACTMALTVGAEATSFKHVGDYFVGSGATVDIATSDPSGTIADRGVLLSFNEGGTVKVGDELMGEFELEYFPVPTEAGYSLSAWSFVFSDEATGNEFSVNVRHDEVYTVSVAFSGVEAGVFYPSYPALTNNGATAVANGGGRYTEIGNAEKIGIKFVPDTMCVYAVADGTDYLVWDMRVEENDNYDVDATLRTFGAYRVELVGNETSFGGGQVLVCSVNGYKTDETVFRDFATPIVGTSITEYGIVGEKYVFSEIYGYDFLDGVLKTTKQLSSPSGKAVRIVNGWFIPEETGDYVLSVSAKNSFGAIKTTEYVITVLEEIPSYELVYDAELLTKTYEMGDTVYVPKLTILGGLNIGNLAKISDVTVYRNGVRMEAHTNVESGFTYTLLGVGEYKFVYEFWGETVEFTVQSQAKDCSFVCEELASVVRVDTTIDITGGKFLIGDEEYEYNLQVKYPDGKVYANPIFVVDSVGKYEIIATVDKDGETYTDTFVLEAYEHAGDMFTTEDSTATFDFDVSKQTGRTGAKITTSKPNTPVVFEREIDLTKYREQTAIKGLGSKGDPVYGAKEDAIPLIEFSVEPVAYGVAATSLVRIYLRDAADLENFICIEVANKGSSTWAYLRARATGQSNMGFDNTASGSDYLNGTQGRRWLGNTYGRGIWYSFIGSIMSGLDNEDHTIKLYYDNEKKQILTRSYSTNPNNLNEILNDFDDTEWCNGPAWKGFISDKAILSVEVASVEELDVEYFIYNAGGISFAEREMKYVEGPSIFIERETPLYGVEGGKVQLPSAAAKDCYGKDVAQFATKVYYKQGESLYDIYTDGKSFVAPRAGEYIVKYIAVDVFGNISEKTIAVDVKDKNYAKLTATIAGGGEYETGSLVRIQPTSDVVVENALGDATVSVSVYYKDGETEIPVTIDPRGDVFVERTGTYVVRYTVLDESGRQTTCEYAITVILGDVVAVYGALPVYAGFVSGESYTIAQVIVKDYSKQTPEPIIAETYIDGVKFTGDVYVAPTLADGEKKTVIIEYKYNGGLVESYVVPIVGIYKEVVEIVGGLEIKRSELNMDKMFVLSENMTATVDGLYIRLTANGDNASATFTNKTAVKGLKTQFVGDSVTDENGNAVDNNVSAIEVTLVDALNANRVIKLLYAMDGKALMLSVNGKSTGKATSGSINGLETNRITFVYGYEDGTIRDASGSELYKLTRYLNGDPFEGFGEYVYITYSILRADETKSASIRVYSLSGQSLSVAKSDQVAPNIYLESDFVGGYYELGSEITVPAASSYDVLNKVKSFTVSVLYTDVVGNVSKLLDNAEPSVAYALKLDKVGTYHVTYRAEDAKGNVMEKVVLITAFTAVDPVITLSGEVPVYGKLNTAIVLPTYSVEFAVDRTENLSYIMIISPSNRYQMLDSAEFTPTERGVYRVRYFALDYYGRYTILEYRISCE